jgi:biotin transporter BioY
MYFMFAFVLVLVFVVLVSDDRQWSTTKILVLIILALVGIIVCFLCGMLVVYGYYLHKRRQEYYLAHSEIPDFIDGKLSVSLAGM